MDTTDRGFAVLEWHPARPIAENIAAEAVVLPAGERATYIAMRIERAVRLRTDLGDGDDGGYREILPAEIERAMAGRAA